MGLRAVGVLREALSSTTLSLLDQQTTELVAFLLRQFWALPEAPYLTWIQGLGEMFAMGLLAQIGDLSCTIA